MRQCVFTQGSSRAGQHQPISQKLLRPQPVEELPDGHDSDVAPVSRPVTTFAISPPLGFAKGTTSYVYFGSMLTEYKWGCLLLPTQAVLRVKDIAAKLGSKPGNISVWFSTTGKKFFCLANGFQRANSASACFEDRVNGKRARACAFRKPVAAILGIEL